MCLNHPEIIPTPDLWKKCFPWNRSLVPKGWGWATFWHFPPVGDLPDPRIEPVSPVLTGRFFITSATWEALHPSCCCCSVAQLCPTLWKPVDCTCQASLFFSISWSLLKLTSGESVMPSNHLILCCPLLLLPSAFPSIMVFSSESTLCIRWPNFGASALTSVLLMNKTRLISSWIDWFDLISSC